MSKVVKIREDLPEVDPLEFVVESLVRDLLRNKENKGVNRITLVKDRYGRSFFVDQNGYEIMRKEEKDTWITDRFGRKFTVNQKGQEII
jgi:CRISPR/Cas system-associated protein Cas10 (large subunit of type III CRISPR-Cas system)